MLSLQVFHQSRSGQQHWTSRVKYVVLDLKVWALTVTVFNLYNEGWMWCIRIQRDIEYRSYRVRTHSASNIVKQ